MDFLLTANKAYSLYNQSKESPNIPSGILHTSITSLLAVIEWERLLFTPRRGKPVLLRSHSHRLFHDRAVFCLKNPSGHFLHQVGAAWHTKHCIGKGSANLPQPSPCKANIHPSLGKACLASGFYPSVPWLWLLQKGELGLQGELGTWWPHTFPSWNIPCDKQTSKL